MEHFIFLAVVIVAVLCVAWVCIPYKPEVLVETKNDKNYRKALRIHMDLSTYHRLPPDAPEITRSEKVLKYWEDQKQAEQQQHLSEQKAALMQDLYRLELQTPAPYGVKRVEKENGHG